MIMYGLRVWTESGNSCETAPYVSSSKEKLMEKYNSTLNALYREDCLRYGTEYTLEEFKNTFYLAGERDIVEMEVV